MKPVEVQFEDIQQILTSRIASLENDLAIEQASKKAIIKYAESLEKKIEELEKKNAE